MASFVSEPVIDPHSERHIHGRFPNSMATDSAIFPAATRFKLLSWNSVRPFNERFQRVDIQELRVAGLRRPGSQTISGSSSCHIATASHNLQ